LIESDEFLTFKCSGDSRLAVTKSSTGTAAKQTKASWRMDDVAFEVAELRPGGIDVGEYDQASAPSEAEALSRVAMPRVARAPPLMSPSQRRFTG
jgi:hypothetical protein